MGTSSEAVRAVISTLITPPFIASGNSRGGVFPSRTPGLWRLSSCPLSFHCFPPGQKVLFEEGKERAAMMPLIWNWTLLYWSTEEARITSSICYLAQLLGGPIAGNMEARGTEFSPSGKGSQAVQRGCLCGFPSLPPPTPTLAFVNKWCGLCCEGVLVFVFWGRGGWLKTTSWF